MVYLLHADWFLELAEYIISAEVFPGFEDGRQCCVVLLTITKKAVQLLS